MFVLKNHFKTLNISGPNEAESCYAMNKTNRNIAFHWKPCSERKTRMCNLESFSGKYDSDTIKRSKTKLIILRMCLKLALYNSL